MNSDYLCDVLNRCSDIKEINSNGNKQQMEVDDSVKRQKTEDYKQVDDDNEKKKNGVVADDEIKISSLKTSLTKPIIGKDTKELVVVTKNKSNIILPSLVNVTQTVGKSIHNSFNQVHHSQTTTINPFIFTTTPALTNVSKPLIITSTLTDDMFIVEAPSFIVPYAYEKSPKISLKEFVEKIVKRDENKSQCEESLDKKNKNNQKERCSQNLVTYENMNVDELKYEVSGCEKKSNDSKENSPINNKDDDEHRLIYESNSSDKEHFKSENWSKSLDFKKSDSIANVIVDFDEKKSHVHNPKIQNPNYFESPFGKFFMQIGTSLVEEHVQLDLLNTQKRKIDHKVDKSEEDNLASSSLIKTLEFNKKNNNSFKFYLKKCELCNFKSESNLVMAHHLETPHTITKYYYRCNFCTCKVRSSHEILQHMHTHNIKGHLEKNPALHQCPNCPFEDNYKGYKSHKLTKHLISCSKKHQPEINQAPPLDWEPPAKIPRVLRNKSLMRPGNAVYQAAMSGLGQFPNPNTFTFNQQQYNNKMVLASDTKARSCTVLSGQQFPEKMSSTLINKTPGGFKNSNIKPTNQTTIIPKPYSMNNDTYRPSISIIPLPQKFLSNSTHSTNVSTISKSKPQQTQSSSTSTNSINILPSIRCEICDGYIKDLEQLPNHMWLIHKVKIYQKMIYNRPPINCKKCTFRFFTSQGFERHLLGLHGLVLPSMQEAADKGRDGGRCPICSALYQCKLLNHISRDHSISLKPSILTYKCTICNAKLGTYEHFENHVYSYHINTIKSSNKKRLGNQPIASLSSPATSSSKF